MTARIDAAASLVELVHARLAKATGWEAESKALARALQLLAPSGGAKRQQRVRDRKRDVTRDATSNASSDASEGSCASRAASESLSSPKNAEILREKRDGDSEKRERAHEERDAPRDAFVTPVVTPKVTLLPKPKTWRRFPADYVVTQADRDLAAECRVDLAAQLALIRDHEFARPKSDAAATLRTWLRRASGFGAVPGRRASDRAMVPVSSTFDHPLPDWMTDDPKEVANG